MTKKKLSQFGHNVQKNSWMLLSLIVSFAESLPVFACL